MLELNNQVALVVGGARGIGAAIVESLAMSGAKVWVFDTDLAPNAYNHYQSCEIGGYKAALELANRLTEKDLAIHVLDVDACSDSAVIEGLDQIVNSDGHPRFLVNAIGSTQAQLAIDSSTEQFTAILQTNLLAPYIVCRELAKRLISHGIGGSFVNIGSIAGKTPFTPVSIYSAAKAGLSAFSTSLAIELAEHSIQVNTVCPGMVRTNMWEYLRNELNEPDESDHEFWIRMADMIPQKRFQTGEAIADTVLMLLRNDEITGQSFSIDGGMNRHA